MTAPRLLLRRAVHQRAMLAAAVAVLMPALILVTLIGLHASAVRTASVRSALQAMSPDTRTVRAVYGSGTEWRATPDQRTAFFAQLHGRVAAAFAGVGAQVDTTVVSGPYVLLDSGLSSTDSVAFWSSDALKDKARLARGQWPSAAASSAEGFPAVVSQQTLAAHHWNLGDTVRTRSGWEATSNLTFRIVGVYQPADPADVFWQHDGDQAAVLVDPSVTARPDTVLAQAAVAATPDSAGFPAGRLPQFAGQLAAFDAWVPTTSSPDGDFAASIEDPLAPRMSALVGVTVVSVRLEWLVAAELGVLSVAALAQIAQALADRRHAMDGLLRARGSSIRALGRVQIVEGLALALPCALLAPWAARWLERRMGATWAHGDSGVAGALDGADRIQTAQWVVALVGAVLAAILLGSVGTRSALTYSTVARVRRRSTLRSTLQRATIDLAVLAFALAALWELFQAGDDASRTGALPWPQVVAPAVLLFAGALIALRLLPFIAAPAGRFAAHGKGALAALVGWRLGRAARTQALPMALLVVAVAIGVQAIVLLSSADRSDADQAGFAVGADVRVAGLVSTGPQTLHALTTTPGTGKGFAALRAPYRMVRADQAATTDGLDETTPTADVLGLDPARSDGVLVLRNDLAGGKSWPRISPLLTGDGWDAHGLVGVSLPGTPTRLSVDLTYNPGSGASCTDGPLQVTAHFTDAYGFPGSAVLGTIAAPDGLVHTLSGTLIGSGENLAYPISISALSVTSATVCPIGRVSVGALHADSRPVSIPAGVVFAAPAVSTDADLAATDADVKNGPAAQPLEFLELTKTGKPGPLIVPAIATEHLLAELDKRVGDTFATGAFSQPVILRFVASIAAAPGSAGGGQDALIVPIGLLDREAERAAAGPGQAGQQRAPLSGQWWADTAGGVSAPSLADRYRSTLTGAHLSQPATVDDRARQQSALRDYPFAAGFSLTLKLGSIAALAFVLLGLALHTVSTLRERARELAVLDALGLTRRRAALLLLAEQAGVALLGALAGLGLGDLALRSEFKLMVFTPSGAPPTPAPVRVYDWPTLGLAGAAAAVFGALAVLLTYALSERASFRAEAN
ncbi:FtsX-like permease family protein [Catenulispora pinisilvae]|uniref:FtsX-like permease family protein n=1 Tax=Catenulispora pinisilvae TaxID=2705253 RepID=UPI001891C0C3|nr:FtsX-like permease family protein [Catenulispora pinisilvae]